MSESSDDNSEGKSVVGRALQWRDEIAAIAGPMLTGDTRESWLARAARKANISFRHAKALFYGEIVDPKVSVALSVIVVAAQARKEARALASRFESLAGAMNAADQDFYSEEVLALLDASRRLRGVDRA